MPNDMKFIRPEPDRIYKCNRCGNLMTNPAIKRYDISEYDSDEDMLCTECESDDLSRSDVKCRCCNTWLFDGEDAYQIGDDLYCKKCVTEVMV